MVLFRAVYSQKNRTCCVQVIYLSSPSVIDDNDECPPLRGLNSLDGSLHVLLLLFSLIFLLLHYLQVIEGVCDCKLISCARHIISQPSMDECYSVVYNRYIVKFTADPALAPEKR